ncbi:Pyridoxal 4-dehydrogenase [Cyphellophora attinorum]|uniref:Pyridoxal 4-dehydrogenase n=1 Tax=Cyphellophora attinorum TaxID=1664694 RepID=A0A0N1GX28_9EURO|nr:Pyridoxal 4-dehydrogenase [Phialophora attinorum]KPI34555.1 Pyridoxal 4-dehydrogenase [Phialophora attinorum]
MADDGLPPRIQPGANIPAIKTYPDKFADHVVLVTGAAQGIGKTTATLFAEQGATVILVDIDGVKLKTLADELNSRGLKSAHHAADMTDELAVHALVKDVVNFHNKVDVLVHLAGIYPFIPIADVSFGDYTRIMDVNMASTFHLTKAVLPHMQRAGYGRIINTSTAAIFSPSAGMSIYTAAKSAVTGFTRAIATEAGPGVTVNAVCPAMIFNESTWSNAGSRAVFNSILDRQFVKRVGLPSDVAHMVSFIASPESEWITGQLFNVTGGAVMT